MVMAIGCLFCLGPWGGQTWAQQQPVGPPSSGNKLAPESPESTTSSSTASETAESEASCAGEVAGKKREQEAALRRKLRDWQSNTVWTLEDASGRARNHWATRHEHWFRASLMKAEEIMGADAKAVKVKPMFDDLDTSACRAMARRRPDECRKDGKTGGWRCYTWTTIAHAMDKGEGCTGFGEPMRERCRLFTEIKNIDCAQLADQHHRTMCHNYRESHEIFLETCPPMSQAMCLDAHECGWFVMSEALGEELSVRVCDRISSGGLDALVMEKWNYQFCRAVLTGQPDACPGEQPIYFGPGPEVDSERRRPAFKYLTDATILPKTGPGDLEILATVALSLPAICHLTMQVTARGKAPQTKRETLALEPIGGNIQNHALRLRFPVASRFSEGLYFSPRGFPPASDLSLSFTATCAPWLIWH
jgi:hypothetical protein